MWGMDSAGDTWVAYDRDQQRFLPFSDLAEAMRTPCAKHTRSAPTVYVLSAATRCYGLRRPESGELEPQTPPPKRFVVSCRRKIKT